MFDISKDSLSKNLKKEGFNIYDSKNRKLNENIFSAIDTEEKAYWLGFLYADGSVLSNEDKIELQIQTRDEVHLIKFKKFVGSSNKITRKTIKLNDKKYYSSRLGFRSKKMKDDLIRLGCYNKKSLILKFPNDEQVPKELKRHFIRGYIDGDGSIVYTDKTLCINLIGTENFIIDFCNYFNLKINTLSDVGISNKRWQSYDRNLIINFLNLIYKDSKIYLERKYAIYKTIIEKCRLH